MKFHFLIFALIITLWSLSLYFYNYPILLNPIEWLKTTISLTIIAIFELFCFIIIISKSSFKKFKIPLIISSIFGIVIILAIFFNDSLIKNYLITPQPQSGTFLLLLFIYAGLGGAILFEKYLKNSAIERLRTTYLLVSFGIFIFAITVLYLFLPLITGQRKYFWLGPVFTLLFLLFFNFGYYLIKKFQEEAAERREAKRLAQEWENLARAKDQFLLSLQHHFRTPLFPLRGYLERILKGTYGREENPVIKEKLIEMKKLADTLYSLLESLLDIQELRMGKRALSLESCQIGNLIEGIVEELRPAAEQKGLYLRFEPPINPMPVVKLDKKRTREAIWNLVDNAIKYTKKGGVTIKSQMTNDKLRIAVQDTGIGMTKEEIDCFLQGKLFERGEEAKKLYGPGRGIGLSIAIEFIKAQGGKIWAESKGWNQGTTFWIELPIF